MTTAAPLTHTPEHPLPPIEAFRAGKHASATGDVREWTAADLQELADSYDPALREAPIVIGHPKSNLPAYGWVGDVLTDGQVLKAQPSTVQPEFADWVQRKLYKKVSLSIYGRTHPNNPTPGRLYLRHVGFLGAQPPAVAGLADFQFADGDDAAGELYELGDWDMRSITGLFRGLRDWLIGQHGQDEADKALPGWQVQSLADSAAQPDPIPTHQASGLNYSEDDDMSGQNDLATREAALATREAALAAGEAALAASARAAQAAAMTAQFSEFADGLVREGRLLPAHRAAIVGVLGQLGASTEVLEFGEGDGLVKQTPAEALQAFLKAQPKVVDFSERAGGAGTDAIDFADPYAINTAAQAYIAEQAKLGREVSVADAVAHVMQGADA